MSLTEPLVGYLFINYRGIVIYSQLEPDK